jgi:pilus assembly protein Flp/PilA
LFQQGVEHLRSNAPPSVERNDRAMQRIRRFLKCDDGATAVEYAVMLALILLACIGAVLTMGQVVGGTYNHSLDEIKKVF